MIISIPPLLAALLAAIATTFIIATVALLTGWRGVRRSAQAASAIRIVELRLTESEAALAACNARLAELLTERERERAIPARPGLRQAVALSRHGASTDELVDTCRIGQNEARLIQMLYGNQGVPAPDAADTGVH